MDPFPIITWTEGGRTRAARWRSESKTSPPARVVVADDAMKADTAYRYACEGTALLWRGDFQNARQLLNAMARRADRVPKKPPKPPSSAAEAFHRHRMRTARRANILGHLLIEMAPDHTIRLGRAPDVRLAVTEAFGKGPRHTGGEYSILPLRELLGIIGAHEWRKKGIDIPGLQTRIHPHYGVFPPTRNEYVKLVARAPLPSRRLAMDIGTGTGVLAAVLAERGVSRVVATDIDPRALECAKENMLRAGFEDRVEIIAADLFPSQERYLKAPLIVFNPPWIPAKAITSLERAVYDPKSRALYRFLSEVPARLEPGGEAWLLLSDLAEHLGLRTRGQLLGAFEEAGLDVLEKIDIRPDHRTDDRPDHPPDHPPDHRQNGQDDTRANDPLRAARAAETTSLWRLAPVDTAPSDN